MASGVTLKAAGLNISPNILELPAGSLVEANNIIIRRDDIVESRRGFNLYGTELPDSEERVKQLFTYKQRILRHYGSKIQYQNGTTNDGIVNFSTFSNDFSETETGLRVKSIEANGNFYFTTSDGIKKISAATGDQLSSVSITPAGVPKAIDLQATLLTTIGDQESFFTQNGVVAYRVLWGKKDAANNLILGAPSESVQVYNPLTQLMIQDFNNLLNRLDLLKGSSSLIDDGDYAQTLALGYTDTATELVTALNGDAGLFSKLDQNILYADNNAISGSAPLTLEPSSFSSDIFTAKFTTSPSPSNYFSAGKNLKLIDFGNTNGVTINGNYSVINVNSSNITFTINAPSVQIRSVTEGGLVTTAVEHNLTPSAGYPSAPVGVVKVLIEGIPGSTANGVQTVTTINSSTSFTIGAVTAGTGGSFKVYEIGTVSISGTTKIESNQYRSIPLTVQINEPGTQAQLLATQTAISECISRLQVEQAGVIPINLRNNYFDDLAETTTSSVKLEFSIPDGIDSTNFYQVYRTAVTTPPNTEFLSTFNAGDEMALVYEAFPSEDELNVGVRKIIIDDNTPDMFRGANLYTNPTTGEGILQANDQPPFAKDINTFKNSLFYVNTKTKQRYSLSLIGVEAMIQNYSLLNTPKLMISNGVITNQYEFILGAKEKTRVTIDNPVNLATSGSASYFTLNSSSDSIEYYIWYNKGTTDPAIANKTGIEVVVVGGDTSIDIARKTISALSPYVRDFSIITGADCTFSIGASTIVNSPNHGLLIGQVIQFTTTGALPTGLAISTNYTITSTTTNTFTIAVLTSAVGSGVHSYKIQPSSSVLIETTSDGAVTNSAAFNTGITISTIIEGVGEDPSANKVLISQSLSPSIAIEETARSLVRVINRSSTSDIYAYYISGVDDTPGKMFFEGKSLSDLPIYLMTNDLIAGMSFSPDLSPKYSITQTITYSAPNTIFDLGFACPYSIGDTIVISNTNTTPTINGVYIIKNKLGNTFTVATVANSGGTKFSVRLASDSEYSSNEEQKHRIYYSKANQPEAVPILNYFDVGASDKKILRIYPLRDSLFVFKEDGLFRVSGEGTPFVQSLFDSSCIAIAADSLGVSNNLIYIWTTQGISAVSEAGVSLASRPIDTEILEIASSRYTNFKTATFGVGYDSDNSYIVWTVASPNDVVATQAYRYSNLTSSWTKFDLSKTCGLVSYIDDRLYLGASDVAYIEQERKLFDRTDYADRQFNTLINPNSYADGILKLTTVSDIEVGDVIVQQQGLTIYDFNSLLRKLDNDPGLTPIILGLFPTSWKNYFYNTFNTKKGDNLRTKIVSLATFLDTLGLDLSGNYLFAIDDYTQSIIGNTAANPTIITSQVYPVTLDHNLISGRIIDITGSNSTKNIDGTFTVTRLSTSTFSIPLSVSIAGTAGTWITDVQDYRDIAVCYNKLIDLLNIDTTIAYSNYRTIDSYSTQESVIIEVDRIFKKVTLSSDLDYVEGDITIYKAINTSFTYGPSIMGDPLSFKHIREATLMFINKQFTLAKMSFSTDLLPTFIEIEFNGDGSGLFGNDSFGTNYFGGVSHSAPFRTYIPRQCQRCRYLNVRFNHRVAREKYGVLGITLTGETAVSVRAYR